MTSSQTAEKESSHVVVKVIYAAFILFSIYYLLKGDIISAASNLGIGLIFDPFKSSWQQRKVWQKAWLLIHLTLVFVLFGFGMKG
jgi:thiol:disulfide interchange protein